MGGWGWDDMMLQCTDETYDALGVNQGARIEDGNDIPKTSCAKAPKRANNESP